MGRILGFIREHREGVSFVLTAAGLIFLKIVSPQMSEDNLLGDNYIDSVEPMQGEIDLGTHDEGKGRIGKNLNNGEPFSVSDHLRTLPDGWHASARQIALAEEQGVSLADNQTYVSSSIKNVH